MDILDINFTPKNATIFYCEKCDFKCNKKSDWDRHILTRKHVNGHNGCLLYTSPSPRDLSTSRMPSSA